MAHSFLIYSIVSVYLGQAGTSNNASEALGSHDSSCTAPTSLFGADALPPPVKEQAVDNPEPSVAGAFPRGYGSKGITILPIVNILQQSLAKGKGPLIDFLVIGRRGGNTDGLRVAVNQNNQIFFGYPGNGQCIKTGKLPEAPELPTSPDQYLLIF